MTELIVAFCNFFSLRTQMLQIFANDMRIEIIFIPFMLSVVSCSASRFSLPVPMIVMDGFYPV